MNKKKEIKEKKEKKGKKGKKKKERFRMRLSQMRGFRT